MAKTRITQHASYSTNKVWRIFHFEQRYEMPEDMKSNRKSGLNYTKRFVGINGGDEAVGYQQQMGILCDGDGVEACFLEGLYGKLVNMAAALSRAKRGYLLDADDQPLSSAQIAKLLNIKAPTMRKMIARFEAVRLVEKVEMPEFDFTKNDPPAGEDRKDKGGKKDAKGGGSGEIRKFPEKSAKEGKPFKKTKPKPKQELGKEEEQRETLTGFSREEEGKADQNRPEQTPATAGEGTAEPENPMNPKESEAEGATKHIVPTPPRSVKRAGPQAIGQIINARFPSHWQDPDAEAFGWEIVGALGLPRDEHNMEIRSEWGAFAKWWSDIKHAAPAMMLGELRAMAIGKAVWIHSGPKKPKHVRNPRALWTDIMAKELVHHGIRLPPARASPPVKAHV